MRSIVLLALAQCGVCTHTWAEPAPRSLDQALTQTLALGQPEGCSERFGVPNDFDGLGSLDAFLVRERDSERLGKELAALCGRSAVASAAALGGSLGSPQTTKTVSQFRLARSRADSRLKASGKRAGLDEPVLLAQLDSRIRPTVVDSSDADPVDGLGLGTFVQIGHERRDRKTTELEAGYRAGTTEGLFGMDFLRQDGLLAGAWMAYRNVAANYRPDEVMTSQLRPTSDFARDLTPAVQADICKIGPGGQFADKGLRLGGFVAKRFGEGFADVGVQYSRRRYSYERNVCAIEAVGGALTKVGANYQSGGILIDDIYGGAISGAAALSEWGVSGRGGWDFGDERLQWGPRLSLTYLRSTLAAYTETGRTSVTNQVVSATGGLTTNRAAGDPTGLEMAFDAQHRSSLQSELQLLASYRFVAAVGTLVPRVALSWVHEFKGERQTIAVHMAQDHRATPTRFEYTSDAVDKNKGNLVLGLQLLRGPQFSADLEYSRLLGDDRFNASAITARALWRY